jgi:hypothetical protein
MQKRTFSRFVRPSIPFSRGREKPVKKEEDVRIAGFGSTEIEKMSHRRFRYPNERRENEGLPRDHV